MKPIEIDCEGEVKHYCDKCGNKVKKASCRWYVEIYNEEGEYFGTVHACGDCFSDMQIF